MIEHLKLKDYYQLAPKGDSLSRRKADSIAFRYHAALPDSVQAPMVIKAYLG